MRGGRSHADIEGREKGHVSEDIHVGDKEVMTRRYGKKGGGTYGCGGRGGGHADTEGKERICAGRKMARGHVHIEGEGKI